MIDFSTHTPPPLLFLPLPLLFISTFVSTNKWERVYTTTTPQPQGKKSLAGFEGGKKFECKKRKWAYYLYLP